MYFLCQNAANAFDGATPRLVDRTASHSRVPNYAETCEEDYDLQITATVVVPRSCAFRSAQLPLSRTIMCAATFHLSWRTATMEDRVLNLPLSHGFLSVTTRNRRLCELFFKGRCIKLRFDWLTDWLKFEIRNMIERKGRKRTRKSRRQRVIILHEKRRTDWKLPWVLRQVAPFWQPRSVPASVEHSLTSSSQSGPCQLGVHWHRKPLYWSTHVAPWRHGLLMHSFTVNNCTDHIDTPQHKRILY